MPSPFFPSSAALLLLLALLRPAHSQPANTSCNVTFKGEQRTYASCKRDLIGSVEVYWTLRASANQLDTLVRARTSGYVGFGWGYSLMTGSNAAIVYRDTSGTAVIADYELRFRSSIGVQPAGNQKLTATDTEVDGDFVAGIFTRKLVEDGIPTIAAGEVDVIWAVGPPPSSPTALEPHSVRDTIKLTVFDTAPGDGGDGVPQPQPPASPSPKVSQPGASPVPGGPTNCIVSFKGKDKAYQACRTLTFGVEVYWDLRSEDGEIDTLFRAPTKGGYVGFGWGYSAMVEGDAVVAFQDSEGSGEVEIRDYHLTGKSTDRVNAAGRQKLTNVEAEVDGDYVAGKFTRKLAVDGLPTISEGETNAIWAVGSRPGSSGKLSQHSGFGSGRVDTSASIGEVEINSRFSTIFTVHAVFMVVAWFLLTPLAILSARFFRDYNPTSFQVHRALNFGSGVLMFSAFVMAVVKGSHTRKAHLAIGCLVFVFVLLQVAAGVLRPKKGTSPRRPWFWAHFMLGYIIVGLSHANVWVGLSIIGAARGYQIACGVVIGLLLLVFILLSFVAVKKPRVGRVPSGEELVAEGGLTREEAG